MGPEWFLKGLVVVLATIGIAVIAPASYAGGKKQDKKQEECEDGKNGGGKHDSKNGSGKSDSKCDPKTVAAFWVCYAKTVQRCSPCVVKFTIREKNCEADIYCHDGKNKKSWKCEVRGGKCSDKKWDGKS